MFDKKKYQADWKKKNHPRLRAEVRAFIRKVKDVPCADCGQRYPHYVMDFDHVRGEKKYTIGAMGKFVSLPSIIREIEKCDIVCSNCHRIRTHAVKEDEECQLEEE